ncbi:MAG TPA: TIGR03067 domain-containing protein [Gemmataceae bacterium]|nr:TIGR03067 domain-containing protein [Gemmataceae bacterium]
MTAVLWLTTAFVAAPALKDREKPAPSLVGEWVIESSVVGGRPSKANRNRWVFRADGTRAIFDTTKELARGTYATDPKANPATLDLDPGPADGVYPCIYRLDGDTLTLNVGWQKSERPAAFESPAGSMCTLYVMNRKKEDRP